MSVKTVEYRFCDICQNEGRKTIMYWHTGLSVLQMPRIDMSNPDLRQSILTCVMSVQAKLQHCTGLGCMESSTRLSRSSETKKLENKKLCHCICRATTKRITAMDGISRIN